MAYEVEANLALSALATAAQFCEQIRLTQQYTTLEKSDKSPVTVADFGAQAIICRAIAQIFPNDSIVGEENASGLRQPDMAALLAAIAHPLQAFIPEATPALVADWIDRGNGPVSQRFWTLDPIDGTKGFLRNDQYAIALALIEAGAVQLGAIACPQLPVDANHPDRAKGVFFLAIRGQGAQQIAMVGHEVRSIHVNTDPHSANFRQIESVESGHGNRPLQRQIAQAVGLPAETQQMDSLAKYGAIARGEAALYLRLPWRERPTYQENIWDHAAGALLVEEAGGKVTDIDGKPLDFASHVKLIHNRGIIASNGVIHAAVLKMCGMA